MFDVITVGGASRDVFFMTGGGRLIKDPARTLGRLIAFPAGNKIIPEVTDFSYGGGGSNTAVSLSRLGLDVSTIIAIGTEGTGSLIQDHLKAEGVNISNIQRSKEHHTAMSMVVAIPGKEHVMFLYRGANNHLKINDWRDLKAKWFYLSSLTGDSADIIPEFFSYAGAHNICVAWNPGSEQLEEGVKGLSSYLEITDILFLNRDEAEKLVKTKNQRIKIDKIDHILKELNEITKGIVVVTDGARGSFVSDHDKVYSHPSCATEIVDTTGAGDAYASTFMAVRFLGYGYEYAMKAASYNAASVIEYVGAQRGLMNFEDISVKIDNE
jgi:sugar/nucleoside kinase (ribokinase family)